MPRTIWLRKLDLAPRITAHIATQIIRATNQMSAYVGTEVYLEQLSSWTALQHREDSSDSRNLLLETNKIMKGTRLNTCFKKENEKSKLAFFNQ